MKLADVVRTAKLVKVEHARKFATHVVPEVVKPARILWNQAIGGVFLLLALSFLGYAVGHNQNLAARIGGIFLGLVMAFFSVTSFLSARKISRH